MKLSGAAEQENTMLHGKSQINITIVNGQRPIITCYQASSRVM